MFLRSRKEFLGKVQDASHSSSFMRRLATGPEIESLWPTRSGLHLIASEPGLLALALDPLETILFMNLTPDQYFQLCADGKLKGVTADRSYFEPLIQFHSFWSILQLRLSTLVCEADQCSEEALEDLLDHIALDLEAISTFEESILIEQVAAAARIFLDETGIYKGSADHRNRMHEAIKWCVMDMLSAFGDFCQRRMTMRDDCAFGKN